MIALIPTSGKDTSEEIHAQKMKILAMAAELEMKVVACAADGAASEFASQTMMDKVKTDVELKYVDERHGIDMRAPVFPETGPMISVTDPQHARKTCRNQIQYGTHGASLGEGYITNSSLVDLQSLPNSGVLGRDVKDPDKQDDGAAHRSTHVVALTAMTEVVVEEKSAGTDAKTNEEQLPNAIVDSAPTAEVDTSSSSVDTLQLDGAPRIASVQEKAAPADVTTGDKPAMTKVLADKRQIRPGFEGLFVYMFVFGAFISFSFDYATQRCS